MPKYFLACYPSVLSRLLRQVDVLDCSLLTIKPWTVFHLPKTAHTALHARVLVGYCLLPRWVTVVGLAGLLHTMQPISAYAAVPMAALTADATRTDTDTAPTFVPQAETQPSLYAVMMAEFAADRHDIPKALAIYKNQSQLDDSAPVFERALSLSLQYESAEDSLAFASHWQQANPDHVPALFYVAHLALKAHNYELAGEKLGQILHEDPNVDLSQILLGIYPTASDDQAELLQTLQKIDTKNNPSLLVMKAGLLLQFNQPKQALVEIDKALKKHPKTPAFLILKADILQALANSDQKTDVQGFIRQARQSVPDNKNLFLYQTRYLLQHGKSTTAWQQLTAPHNSEFLADDEIKLLAGLVGIDTKNYTQAEALLQQLTHSPSYRDQAYYYLAISAERQQRTNQAIKYYGNVMQPNLVMAARKKQVALLIAQQRYSEAVTSMEKLRADFDEFAVQSYIMQANILAEANQTAQALALLNDAQSKLPDNTDIMFAKVQLLPDDDLASKRQLLEALLKLSPNNIDYQLEYAQTLVNLKIETDNVVAMLSPLINDREIGLRARQILAQQALHQNDNARVITLLSDNFDIVPDIISGLLLRQAYANMGNTTEVQHISHILKRELDYADNPNDTGLTNNGNPTTVLPSDKLLTQ